MSTVVRRTGVPGVSGAGVGVIEIGIKLTGVDGFLGKVQLGVAGWGTVAVVATRIFSVFLMQRRCNFRVYWRVGSDEPHGKWSNLKSP